MCLFGTEMQRALMMCKVRSPIETHRLSVYRTHSGLLQICTVRFTLTAIHHTWVITRNVHTEICCCGI